MRVKVVRREGPKDQQGRPPAGFHESLTSKEFDLDLEVVPGISKTLTGTHVYQTAAAVYQRAKEHWVHRGLFGAPSL